MEIVLLEKVINKQHSIFKSRCVVLVDVIDVNNNAPEFLSQPNVTLTGVMRSYQYLNGLNDPIHYFVAKDDDFGAFGEVSYEIVDNGDDSNFNQIFHLNQNSGF